MKELNLVQIHFKQGLEHRTNCAMQGKIKQKTKQKERERERGKNLSSPKQYL